MLDEIVRAKSITKNKWFRTRENVQVELVLELDPNHKRSKWKLARVIAKYQGNNGLIRKARIKTQDSEYETNSQVVS